MRRRSASEKSTKNLWSLKQLRGGTVDIEFIVHYLALRHANDHPEILEGSTLKAVEKLIRAGVLNSYVGSRLSAALIQWHRIQGFLSLAVEDFENFLLENIV